MRLLEEFAMAVRDRFGRGGTRWKLDVFEDTTDGEVFKVRILVEPTKVFPLKLGGTFNRSVEMETLLDVAHRSIARACSYWPMRDPLWALEDEVCLNGRVIAMVQQAHDLAGWMGDPDEKAPAWWEYLLASIRKEDQGARG